MNESRSVLPIFDWMVEKALPLWASEGWDAKADMFVERLTLDGRPLLETPRRVMVQARQIFVYSVAHRRGWCTGAGELAARAADSMIRRYYRVDDAPSFVFSLLRDGVVADPRRDFYAHAFVLLSLASAYEVTGDPALLALAQETLDFMDREMTSPAGGYVEALPMPTGPRRQNPHMHLFESLLALHAIAPQHGFLARANGIVQLLRERFLQNGGQILVEFFDASLRPLGGPNFPFEPGHHFEWAFLLARWAELSGHAHSPKEAGALWLHALRAGLAEDGKIFDKATAEGCVDSSTRLWTYAEAARAASVMAGEPDTRRNADFFLGQLYERFLEPAAQGCWIDWHGTDGRPKVDFVPASSLYHICGALDTVAGSSS